MESPKSLQSTLQTTINVLQNLRAYIQKSVTHYTKNEVFH